MSDETSNQQSIWPWLQEDESGRPDGVCTRGSLDLSRVDDDVCRQGAARRLHAALEARLGTVDLVVTDNRRRMITSRRRRRRQVVRVHHMFVGCDAETVDAIAELSGDGEGARERLREYIDENRDAIRFQPDDGELETNGEHFALDDVLEAARDHLDGDQLEDIAITWGRDGRGSKSIRLGSFDFDRRLVRIHPALDQSWVPEYFIEYVVYHELLHAVCPPEAGGHPNSVHTPAFRELERAFPRYEEAIAWEKKNLQRILDRS